LTKMSSYWKLPAGLRQSSQAVAIYYHEDCVGHQLQHHPERPERIKAVMSRLKKEWPIHIFREAASCSDEQILRYHNKSHLLMLEDLFSKVSSNGNNIEVIDSDTKVMWRTKSAAYKAAGAVIAAIDDIYRPIDDPMKIKLRF